MKSFPGEMLSFRSFSRDDAIVLFRRVATVISGDYYVYDRTTAKACQDHRLQALARQARHCPDATDRIHQPRGPSCLASTPPARAAPARPMIVMAHGGPYGRPDIGVSTTMSSSSPVAGMVCCRSTTGVRTVVATTSQLRLQLGHDDPKRHHRRRELRDRRKAGGSDNVSARWRELRRLHRIDAADPQSGHVQVRDRLRRRVRPCTCEAEQEQGQASAPRGSSTAPWARTSTAAKMLARKACGDLKVPVMLVHGGRRQELPPGPIQ